MFEYEGHQYTAEEVQKAAESNGLSIEEYIAKVGINPVEEAKTEGVAQGEATVSPVETPATELSSEDGSSDSQEVKVFDPTNMPPVIQEEETYMGVSRKPMMPIDVNDLNEMQALVDREFKGQKNQSKTVQSPKGPILSYEDDEYIKEFDSNIMSSVVSKDEKLQSLIKSTVESNQDKIKEGFEAIMSPYKDMDQEDITQEDFDKIQKQYSKLINGIVFSNPDVQKRYNNYADLLGDVHQKENDAYVVDKEMDTLIGNAWNNSMLQWAYKNMPDFSSMVYKGTHRIGTDIKKGGLSQAPYLKVQQQHERNVARAEQEGWDDNTVGYYNSKGAFMVPKQGGIHPTASGFTEKGTWGEAKQKAQDIVENGKEQQKLDMEMIHERMAVESAFGEVDIRGILRSGESWHTFTNLLGEQLPQMASAILSFGTLPAAQMTGENYFRQVEKKAKVKYNTLQPSIDQMMKVIEDDVNDEIFESASVVGAYSGAAEYIGASSVLNKSLGGQILRQGVRQNQASLVKGQFKRFLTQQRDRGITSLRGGFDEMMTELFQTAASDVTVNEFNAEHYFQSGGAGFVMGFALPMAGNISSATTNEVRDAYRVASGKLDLKGMNQFHSFVKNRLDQDLKKGTITKELYDQKLDAIENYMLSSTRIDQSMSEDHKRELMDKVVEEAQSRKNLDKFKNSEEGKRAEFLQGELDENLKSLDKRLKNGEITEDQHVKERLKLRRAFAANVDFRKKLELQQKVTESIKNTSNVTDFYNNLNSTINAFSDFDQDITVVENTRQYATEYLKSKGLEVNEENILAMQEELKNSPGVFIGNNNKIIVNAEGSIATRNTTTSSHEVLHRVLKKALTTVNEKGKTVQNEEVVKNISNALIKHIVKLESEGKISSLNSFRNKLFNYATFYVKDQKYSYAQVKDAFAQDGRLNLAAFTDIKLEEFRGNQRVNTGEEVLTLLSDALQSGKLKYNASLFEQLGDIIRRALQSVGLKKIKFDTGQDVFNFVRDYNTSVKKGRSTKAQREFSRYGGRGVLTQYDKNSVGARAAADAFSKSEPTQAQKDMSDKVQQLWDEQGVGALYELSEMYRPMFRKIVTRGNWDQLPGWDNYKDIIEDDALTDYDGMLGILMTYNAEKGVPLAAYINKYFALRAAKVKNKYLGETFDKNVDDLKGGGPAISQEEEIEQALDKPAPNNEFSVIRRKLNLDPNEMNIVRAIVTRTLSLSPDLLSERKWKPSLFRSFLLETYKRQIYKTILDKFPTRSARFIQWATQNKSWIERELSLNTLRKFPALNGVLYEFQKDEKGNVMRYTAEESRKLGIRDEYSGVNKIRRKFPNEEEWANYLDPTRIGRSRNMPHEHKRILAEAMSIDIGLDATLEVMQNPNQQQFDLEGNPIEGRVINMYERMVENNADIVEENQVLGRVAYLIERDPLVKFSKSAEDMGATDLRMSELIFENPEPILQAFRDTVAPYRLMPDFKRDNTLGQLRIALTNALINTFKTSYPWLNEASASVLSKQLALDFASIARKIDTAKLKVHEKAEKAFTDALADNLFNIAQNNVLNQGHTAVLGTSNGSIDQSLRNRVLEKVFNDGIARQNILPFINGETSNPGLAPAVLQSSLKKALSDIKTLYANGNLTRDEVRLFFETIFNDSGSRKALVNFAAPIGLRMVGLKPNITQNMFSIPTKYLSGYLSNVVVNPRKNASDIDILNDFVVVQVTKKYANKLISKQGIGMPHFRNNIEPTFLSRISRVSVGNQGTSNSFEVYRNGGTEFAGTIDQSALVGLDYNGKLASNIQGLIDSLPDMFSKEESGNKKKKKSLKELDDEIKGILEELQQTGSLSQDPKKQAERQEEERLNKLAEDLDAEFNKILEDTTGIDAGTEFARIQAKQMGKGKNERIFFVPPSHDDFRGLIENYLVGKGEKGDAAASFFEEHLFEPYYEGVNNYSSERVRMLRQFADVRKAFKGITSKLKAEAFPGMSVENAIRVYIWTRLGYEVPGINQDLEIQAKKYVVSNGLAREMAFEVMKITELHGHVEPKGKDWDAGGLIGDIIDSLKKNSRSKYLQEWQQNVDFIFNEKNKNKMRAAFGNEYMEALDNILYRMKTGRNMDRQMDAKSSKWYSWLNGSVGVVMFMNTRSAVLQLISFTNYMNLTWNNPVTKALPAYLNQKQFWADAVKLWNSDFMKERRQGLKIDINEAELADATASATNKFKAAVSWLLSKGFMPTQVADSVAIIMGGAPFYRNAVKRYVNLGFTEEEAESQAFIDFRNKTEESQQSSSPDRISMQQASTAGRLLLTFANTQSQYDRIIKKELKNLKNSRGSAVESLAKISYYGILQNALFVSMQTAILGALMGIGDEEEPDTIAKDKNFRLINGVLDSFLRGAGIRGHVASVIKNIGVEAYDRSGRPNPDYEMLAFKAADLAPAIGSKMRRIRSAAYYFNKAARSNDYQLDLLKNNEFLKGTAVATSAVTNLPLDRLLQKFENVYNTFDFDADYETHERVLMMLGWPDYQIGAAQEESKKSKTKSRSRTRSRKRKR